jgi:hypothetical protein
MHQNVWLSVKWLPSDLPKFLQNERDLLIKIIMREFRETGEMNIQNETVLAVV